MLVIRLKANPLKIKSFGYTKPTLKQPFPLGVFDQAVFEQVELEALPEGWEPYTPQPGGTGKDLFAYLMEEVRKENKRTGKSLQDRSRKQFELKSKFESWKTIKNGNQIAIDLWNILANDQDPMSEKDFNDFVTELNASKAINGLNGDISLIINLANQWRAGVSLITNNQAAQLSHKQ